MRIRGVIFDLDGTLLDTLPDLAEAVNTVLARHGFPTHPIEGYRLMVGFGAITMIERAVPPEARSPDRVEALFREFEEEYERRAHLRTRPYPGIPELLGRLREAGVRLAVLSNKPHHAVEGALAPFFDLSLFDVILGHREGLPPKPDPRGVYEILAAWSDLGPEDVVLVGDSEVDLQTARAAGIQAVAVTWGFRTEEELRDAGARILCHSVEELSDLLSRELSPLR
ncbi:HAD family hydrolase [Spirochaeta thermophila]|uniref:phosphoglycolate phosphatase n=1 Tax=Winmispira thermophila (strain ATCC 49972 / DSM 6192 / RI 19.B1) TaxID=665571 RepID=E0RP17_WINT6|nr:HAD family hydrolase [Spirochaeta thermophila]ADN02679.1 putative hydrolase [Spirochaeta thermophila DSM 6192]